MKRASIDQNSNSHENTFMRVISGSRKARLFQLKPWALSMGFIAITSLSAFSQDDGEYRDIQTLMGGNESVGATEPFHCNIHNWKTGMLLFLGPGEA